MTNHEAGKAKADTSQVLTFQDMILRLQRYWADLGCVIMQPYDNEVGAGTFHTATTLRSLGPATWQSGLRSAVPPPCRRSLRRKPQPPAALLPVPGAHEAFARQHPGSVPGLFARYRHRSRTSTTCASSKTTGKARRSAPGALAGKYGSTAWK